MIVNIGSHLAGWYVSDKLKPVTDKAVDTVADYIASKRQNTEENTPAE